MKKVLLIAMFLMVNFVVAQEHVVKNHTNMKYLDSVVLNGLQELEIGKVRVAIRPMREIPAVVQFESRFGSKLQGFIRGYNKRYVIYVGNYGKWKTTDIVLHELIHLKQYYNGRLKMVGRDVYFNGKFYENAKDLRYNARPWEREAYRNGRELNKILKKY